MVTDMPMLPWIAVFFDPGTKCWWHRFLKDGFKHVTLIGYQPPTVADEEHGHWLYVDYRRKRMDVLTVSGDKASVLFQWLNKHEARFVETRATVNEARPSGINLHLGGMNCVETAKHVLNLRDPSILTPYQLYRTLLSTGGNQLEDDDGLFL